MGYFVHVYSPDTDTPTGQVADVEVTGSYDDLDAVRAFASGVDVVTFEFENVSAAAADAAAEFVPVRPAGRVLHVAQDRLRAIARAIVEALDCVGVLCVEFFLTRDGRLLVNEIAPRPHNSAHLTFDASVTSQFEQQARAACGLPLGSTELLRPAAMANLLGDLWGNGTPDWGAVCRFETAKLHLYGKPTARPGRKMGHITALAETPREAER